MKRFLWLFVLVTGCSVAQVPRPYLAGGVALFPSGYQPAGWEFGGGLTFDRSWMMADSFAGYDNGRKENDGGPPNPKGHDRMLRGFAGYRHWSTYIGAGARWDELSTTNYTKANWHPELGIGHDFWPDDPFAPNFARLQVAYAFKAQHEIVHYPTAPSCSSCGNESRGVDITLWFPSPACKKYRHVFAKMNVFVFGFHNYPGEHGLHWADSTEILMGYRF